MLRNRLHYFFNPVQLPLSIIPTPAIINNCYNVQPPPPPIIPTPPIIRYSRVTGTSSHKEYNHFCFLVLSVPHTTFDMQYITSVYHFWPVRLYLSNLWCYDFCAKFSRVFQTDPLDSDASTQAYFQWYGNIYQSRSHCFWRDTTAKPSP